MKGRPRKNVEAKILAGTFRADRDGVPAVPTFGVPVKPARLNGEASAFWDAVVPGLVAWRVAGAADAPELEAMCWWWGVYRRASEQLDKLKSLATRAARVLAIQAAEAYKRFDGIACRFGLTPADRARLKVEAPPPGKLGVASRDRGTA